ncbi:MAG: endolytic transglycosylase MltG [Tissierellia bacterium]|nr:endolytic transglycosylase MltG [Tissierellia bacterium]
MEKKAKIIYLTLGIGIGIVITCTLYSFYPVTKFVEISDDIIIERARELGMVTLKESLNMEADNVIEASSDGDNENNENLVKGSNSEKIEDEKGEPKAANNKSSEDKSIKFLVERGERLSDIAKRLYGAGLIDNIDEFKLFAREKGYERIIRYGEYDLIFNSSYDDILQIITRIE